MGWIPVTTMLLDGLLTGNQFLLSNICLCFTSLCLQAFMKLGRGILLLWCGVITKWIRCEQNDWLLLLFFPLPDWRLPSLPQLRPFHLHLPVHAGWAGKAGQPRGEAHPNQTAPGGPSRATQKDHQPLTGQEATEGTAAAFSSSKEKEDTLMYSTWKINYKVTHTFIF